MSLPGHQSPSKIIIFLSDGETSVDLLVDINKVIQKAVEKNINFFYRVNL